MIQKGCYIGPLPSAKGHGAMFQRQAKGAFKTTRSEQWPAKLWVHAGHEETLPPSCETFPLNHLEGRRVLGGTGPPRFCRQLRGGNLSTMGAGYAHLDGGRTTLGPMPMALVRTHPREGGAPSGNVYGGLPGADRGLICETLGWAPRKFFAFLMANSKGSLLDLGRSCIALFIAWDFSIGIGAIQGHSRLPEQVSEAARGERLTLQRCQQLGCIFHASENQNYESSKLNGLSLRATRQGWQRHRLAIHLVYFVYACVSRSSGTAATSSMRCWMSARSSTMDMSSDNGVVLS